MLRKLTMLLMIACACALSACGGGGGGGGYDGHCTDSLTGTWFGQINVEGQKHSLTITISQEPDGDFDGTFRFSHGGTDYDLDITYGWRDYDDYYFDVNDDDFTQFYGMISANGGTLTGSANWNDDNVTFTVTR